MKELWVEKYRPKTVDGYVFRDDAQRAQVNTWIKDKTIPHLLFSGNEVLVKQHLLNFYLMSLKLMTQMYQKLTQVAQTQLMM